jgi:hypothetical protein
MSILRNRGRVVLELSEPDHALLVSALGYAAGAAVSGHQSRVHDMFIDLMTRINDLPDGPVAVPDADVPKAQT